MDVAAAVACGQPIPPPRPLGIDGHTAPFAGSASVTDAARYVGMSRQSARDLYNRSAPFRAAWDDALRASVSVPAGQWSKPQFGKDLDRVDAALAALFARVAVDPRRVGVAGFSHGASYALMLGTANPQLFGTIVALSPGILIVGDPPGGQNVYVAHGKGDTAQPYSRTEKVFVPRLGQLGYRVTFQPFAGGHGIPREVLAKAVRFFLTAKPPGNSEAIPGAGAGRTAGRSANPSEPVRRGQAALPPAAKRR